jgi:maltoporin
VAPLRGQQSVHVRFYAFTQNFKLQAELGVSHVTQPNGGDAMKLTKLTIAPTISMGESYWVPS